MFGLICSPIAKIKSMANQSSECIDEILYGSYVEILDEVNYYYYIKTFYNYEGYIKKDDVCIMKSKQNHMNVFNGITTKHFVDVLYQPNIKSQIILTIPRGSYIKVLPECENSFQAIELINKQKGYIKIECFKYRIKLNPVENEEIMRNNLVSNAMLYLNCQYRWGGKTIEGVDCSGLCHISYLLEETIIYRDAIINDELLNIYNMKKIDKASLKPADLIYTPNHMMMYLGNEQYIHSSTSTSGVSINSLKETDSNYIKKNDNEIIGCATIFKL